MAGGIIALTPGLRVANGEFGLAASVGQPTVLKQGTRYLARFLFHAPLNWQVRDTFTFDTDTEAWMRAIGLTGETPYALAFTRGTAARATYFVPVTTDRHGVAGTVAKPAVIPFPVPLRVSPVNPRWPAGCWRADGALEFAGVFEGTAWPQLDVAKAGAFYAGNLVTADHEALVLEIVKWTPNAITLEAHNPTDAPITTTVRTPAEITNLCALTRQITVPAGSSLRVTAP
jgi:hypothetical protein